MTPKKFSSGLSKKAFGIDCQGFNFKRRYFSGKYTVYILNFFLRQRRYMCNFLCCVVFSSGHHCTDFFVCYCILRDVQDRGLHSFERAAFWYHGCDQCKFLSSVFLFFSFESVKNYTSSIDDILLYCNAFPPTFDFNCYSAGSLAKV